MQGFPNIPVVWLAVTALLQWIAARVIPVHLTVPFLAPLLTLAGVALAIWSAVFFLRHKTPIEPNRAPSHLITGGPYELTRNPIYLAMALVLAGWTLWLDAPLGLLLIAGFVHIINRNFIAGEEEGLRATFGAEAEDYMARTPRWLFR